MTTRSTAPAVAGAFTVCCALISLDGLADSPGHVPPGNPRTLDLTAVPMSITEPGTYVVRHNWDLGDRTGFGGTAITVLASDVVIDFQGYKISSTHIGTGVKIKGDNVTLRNGFLGADIGSAAIRSSGFNTVVDHMSIYSHDGLPFTGDLVVIRDSQIYGRTAAVKVANNAVIERNEIGCHAYCVILGNNNRLEHNRVTGTEDDLVDIRGDANVVADNEVDGGNKNVVVNGGYNVLLRNTLRNGFSVAIDVNGAANTLDANVAPPKSPAQGLRPLTYGIQFLQPGNFYGNNRMWAQTPYQTSGLPQVDWGGNVGY